MTLVLTLTSDRLIYKLHPELVHQVEQLLFSKGATNCFNYWLAQGMAAEINFDGIPEEVAHESVELFLERVPVDKNIQKNINRRKKMLLADMDSTILQIETLDEIGHAIGKAREIAEITEKAMNGDIDFETALRNRVKLLAGLNINQLIEFALEKLVITQGASTLVKTMRANGATTALVSGGFTAITEIVRKKLNFDLCYGNTLVVDSSIVTGNLKPPIIDGDAKAAILDQECEKLEISRHDTLAVGDGANDIPMLVNAGLGVGFRPKPVVRNHASNIIEHCDLRGILFLQGFADNEFLT